MSGFLLARSYDGLDPEIYDHLGHLFAALGKQDVARVSLETTSRLRNRPPAPPSAR